MNKKEKNALKIASLYLSTKVTNSDDKILLNFCKQKPLKHLETIFDIMIQYEILLHDGTCPFIRVSLKQIFSAKLCLDSLILILFKVDCKRNISNKYHLLFQINQPTYITAKFDSRIIKQEKLTEEVLLLFL